MILFKVLFMEDDITVPSAEDFINKIIPNFWGFLVQLLAFIIMIVIFMKLAYKPVIKFLEKRRNYIDSSIKNAGEMKAEAESYLEESKKNLISSKKQASDIVSEAVNEAKTKKAEIIDSANEEIILNKQKAKEEIEQEKQKAIKEVHDEVVELALEASKQILKRDVNSEDNQKLIEDLVDTIKEK